MSARGGSSARQPVSARVRTPFATTEGMSGGTQHPQPSHSTDPPRSGRRKARKSAPGGRSQHQVPGHAPPKYDIYGQQLRKGKGSGLGHPKADVFHTSSGAAHIPKSWTGTPVHTTPGQVRAARRKEFLAHPSFDLDGDGVVNQRDYFFAKRFDKDKDGKLNAREWAAAQKALKEGYANKFHVVTGGPATVMAHRVLQKRGHVLMEEKEGWSELHTTFSPQDLRAASHKAPFARSSEGGAKDADPRYRTRTPMATTWSQLRKERHKRNVAELRDLAGEPQAPPDAPSPLAQRPKVSTTNRRSRLLKNRRQEATLEALAKQNLPISDVTGRPFQEFINERLSRTDMRKSASRKELLGTRTKQFKLEAARMAPTKPPGVHTVVLPSHAKKALAALEAGEAPPMWWSDTAYLDKAPKLPWQEEGRPARMVSSRRETRGKHTGKLLSCTGLLQDDSIASDPFKQRTITPSEIAARTRRRRELSKKPTQIRPKVPGTLVRPETGGSGGGPAVRKKRWTDFVIEFQSDASQATMHLDATGKAPLDPAELEPMFSSFTRTGVFDGRASTARRAASTAGTTMRRSRSERSRLDYTFGRPALLAHEEQHRAATAAAAMGSHRPASGRPGFGGSASQPVFGGVPRYGTPAGGAQPRRRQQHHQQQQGAAASTPGSGLGGRTSHDFAFAPDGHGVLDGGGGGGGGGGDGRRGAGEGFGFGFGVAAGGTNDAPSSFGAAAGGRGGASGSGSASVPSGLRARPSTSVRAGGFQRLIETGTLRHSVSTPLLSARTNLERRG